MLEAERSQWQVANVLGVSQSVVSRMWNPFRKDLKCLALARRRSGTFNDLSTGPTNRSSGSVTLRPYVTTVRMLLVCI